jgi:hypothetical protein
MRFLILTGHPGAPYVTAPKGYRRTAAGTVERDGSPSPEYGPAAHAYRFRSRQSAARTASAMAAPDIRTVQD